jgi:Putative beta-barrel porin 2
MSQTSSALIFLMVILGAGASGVRAQSSEPPSNAPLQAGPLVLAPVITLRNVGHDSNVFNTSRNENPQSDVTATLSPSVDAWLRMAHARVNGRTQFDAYYFRQLTDLRAIDTDTSAHIEVPVNRVLIYATGLFTNTRHRQNLEIDALARRRNDSVTAGVDVRLTAKLTAGAFERRTDLRYKQNSLFFGTDLARVLNHTSAGEGAELRYALTPLTTIAVGAELSRDRFDFATDRDSDNRSIGANIQFNPRALISGGASFAVQEHQVLGGLAPNFNGSVMAADLGYSLLGRTRFTVTGRRQLEYSYIDDTDYLRGGIALMVTQRVGDSLDVGGSVGRDRLSYRRNASLSNATATPGLTDETVYSSIGTIRYNLGHTTIGVDVEYRERLANQALAYRGYERLRMGLTLIYAF